MAESTIILTTGQPGAGKSYSRVRWLVIDYLINNTGRYITNLPIDCNMIADELSKKTGRPREHFIERLVVIPKSVLDVWYSLQHENKTNLQSMREKNEFSPALYFDEFDLTNAHIALDEFHLYFSKNHPPILRELWNIWFAEIRKLGCTFEAITQDMSLLPREFVGKVGRRIDLVPIASTRDPFCHILMGDWYELRAGFTGINEQKVQQTEFRKGTSFTGSVKWVPSACQKFVISPDYYRFYNSYQRNDNQRTGKVITPAQRLGKRVVFWFLRRNFFKLFSRFLMVMIFFWLCFGGGFTSLIGAFVSTTQRMALKNGAGGKASGISSEASLKSSVSSSKSAPVKPPRQTVRRQHASSSNFEHEGQGGDIDQSANTPVVDSTEAFKPAMFFEDRVWLRNGIKIFKGYEFKQGVLNGWKVVAVDREERCYTLDNNRVFYMF